MNLSEHFTLEELTRSETASRRGLCNTPRPVEQANLSRLCQDLLEPIRDLLGVPLHINSGFRSLMVNGLVGGSRNSAHLDGRAADFVPVGMDLREAFDRIRASGLPFDQLILECNAWLHVGQAPAGQPPRGNVMLASGSPGNWTYTHLEGVRA